MCALKVVVKIAKHLGFGLQGLWGFKGFGFLVALLASGYIEQGSGLVCRGQDSTTWGLSWTGLDLGHLLQANPCAFMALKMWTAFVFVSGFVKCCLRGGTVEVAHGSFGCLLEF